MIPTLGDFVAKQGVVQIGIQVFGMFEDIW